MDHPFRRIFIFDHGLGNLPGHWPNFHRLLVDQSRKFGLEPLILGFIEIQRDLIGNLPVRPFFRFGPAACLNPDIRENHRLRNTAFLDELNQLDIDGFNADDVFVFTFVMNYELEAILRFSSRFPSRKRPVFLILLQFDNGLSLPELPDLPFIVRFDRWLKCVWRRGPASEETGQVAELYRSALRRGWRRQQKVVFMAPSDGLDLLFAQVLDRDVHPYCMPWLAPKQIADALTVAPHPGTNGGGRTVAFLGHSCMRKGLQFMPAIATAIRERRQDVRFDVQVNYSPEYPLAHVFRELFEQPLEGVTYHEGHLDNEQYFAILNRSDVVLFPYSNEVYRYMPSGLLREAVAAGKVLVVPDNTSLSRQAQSVDAGAVVFDELSADSVARALDVALTCFDSLRNKAADAAVRWNKLHNPHRFMEQLLEQAVVAARQG